MGFFSSIKRLLFVQKSVAKSAANKSAVYNKNTAYEIADKTQDMAQDAGASILEKTSGLRDAVKNTADDVLEKAKEVADDLTDTVKNVSEDVSDGTLLSKAKDAASSVTSTLKDTADDILDSDAGQKLQEVTSAATDKVKDLADTVTEKVSSATEALGDNAAVKKAATVSEDVGDKVLTAGEEFMEKAANVSEKVGTKVLEKGSDMLDSAGELSEKVGAKAMDIKDDIAGKAQVAAEKIEEKFDETMAKAEKMAAEEAANPTGEFSKETLDTGGSLLEGTDDFFSKAAQFGDGDYNAFDEGKTILQDERVELPKAEVARAAGFTDLDGDGNEMIDDAILSEEE